MSKRAVITLAPMMVLLIGAFLWVRPNQAKFYSEETLLERASLARDKALSGSACEELKLATTVDSPPGGVRVYVWNCLARDRDSREVIVKVLNDGETQTVTNPLPCQNDPDARARGFTCSAA